MRSIRLGKFGFAPAGIQAGTTDSRPNRGTANATRMANAARTMVAARAARIAVGCKFTVGAMNTAATLSSSTLATRMQTIRLTKWHIIINLQTRQDAWHGNRGSPMAI